MVCLLLLPVSLFSFLGRLLQYADLQYDFNFIFHEPFLNIGVIKMMSNFLLLNLVASTARRR